VHPSLARLEEFKSQPCRVLDGNKFSRKKRGCTKSSLNLTLEQALSEDAGGRCWFGVRGEASGMEAVKVQRGEREVNMDNRGDSR